MKDEPKDIGILMAGEMVRATMSANPDEAKTVTRRLVKPQPDDCSAVPVSYDGIIDRRHRFGESGRRMWVRETWRDEAGWVHYRADVVLPPDVAPPWRPSLLMPKWAARLWLRRDGDVTCERLHDITEEDAQREGMALVRRERGWESEWDLTLRDTFARYIDEVNGKGTWSKNPWVWRVPFVREVTP